MKPDFYPFYNFVTRETEYIAVFPETDEAAKQYIPQEALCIYERYRAMGDTTDEAAFKAMQAFMNAIKR